MKNWIFTTESKKLEYYQGQLIHADSGVHGQAFELFQKYVRPGQSVLDVGAGAGAFTLRLHDHGFQVDALDVDESKWGIQDIPFLKLDLNVGIKGSVQGNYDAVCCLEVVEHIENPWNLFRDVWAVTKPGGYFLLTTPNITSFLSRLLFFSKGRFHQFDVGDLSYGHINPMTGYEIELVAKQTGWGLIETQPGGYLPVFDFSQKGLRSLVFNLFRGLSYLLVRGAKKGGF